MKMRTLLKFSQSELLQFTSSDGQTEINEKNEVNFEEGDKQVSGFSLLLNKLPRNNIVFELI